MVDLTTYNPPRVWWDGISLHVRQDVNKQEFEGVLARMLKAYEVLHPANAASSPDGSTPKRKLILACASAGVVNEGKPLVVPETPLELRDIVPTGDQPKKYILHARAAHIPR